MDSLINKLIIGLVIGIFLLYFGIRLAKDVNDNILYGLFWLVYIITILVIGNGILNFYFVKEINKKEGPKGDKGVDGDDGDEGIEADCDPNCKINGMIRGVIQKLELAYNNILEKERKKKMNPPSKINNQYIIQTIKRICLSKEFNELSQIMHPTVVVYYILQLFYKWIGLIAQADKSEGKKHLQDYMEIYGEVVEWEFMVSPDNNPFREIEKYDAFYWGLDKQFKPIIKNVCIEQPKEKNGPIQAIKTNLYSWRYNDKGTKANRDLTTWISEPIKFNNKTYYPLGQVFTGGYSNLSGGGRYIEALGSEFPFRFNLPGSSNGPQFSNVMVAYDENDKYWVRKPEKWTWLWNDDQTKGKLDGTFWHPQDFEADGQKYKCFGSVATKYYASPNNDNIVCINEKALEEVPHQHRFVWNSKGAGKLKYRFPRFRHVNADNQGGAYMNYDGTYNTGYLTQGWGVNQNRKTYKIKDEYLDKEFRGPLETKPFTSKKERTDNTEYGEGYQNPKYTHKQDRKGSLFDLLDLTIEAYYINEKTKQKVRLKHSGTNIANCYLIYIIDFKNVEKCINVDSDLKEDNVDTLTDFCNPLKDLQLWEIEFVGDSSQRCLIKSRYNQKYLYSTENNLFKITGKLPSQNDTNFNQFVWKIIKKI